MAGIQSLSVSSSQSYASVAPQNQQSLAPFANLDLSASQKTQIRSILASAKQNGTSPADVQKQIDGVLNPAQQQKLQSDLSALRSRHHHHHGGGEATDSQSAAATAGTASSTGANASAASTSPTAASTTTTSTDASVLQLVANLQNQAAAARSTNVNTLKNGLVVKVGAADAQAAASATTPTSATSNARSADTAAV